MSTQAAVRNYQQNSVMTSDPLRLVLFAYDRAITSCYQQEPEIAGKAIMELIKGLDMDAGEIAVKLLSIYQYCAGLVRKKQYEEAASILRELRDTWSAVRGRVDVIVGNSHS
jgi:flagellin-specific chaperone FliS